MWRWKNPFSVEHTQFFDVRKVDTRSQQKKYHQKSGGLQSVCVCKIFFNCSLSQRVQYALCVEPREWFGNYRVRHSSVYDLATTPKRRAKAKL